jgi:hypothetical protein
MTTDSKFDVTVVTKTGQHIRLQVPRTSEECAALRARGHAIIVTPTAPRLVVDYDERPKPNMWAPTPYSQALRAVAELHSYAVSKGDAELMERAADAVKALLRGQHIGAEEAPSSVQRIRPVVEGISRDFDTLHKTKEKGR